MNKMLIIFFFSFSCSFSHAQEDLDSVSFQAEKELLSQYEKIPEIDSLINFARDLKGIPYVWGGHTKKGLDCTGFVHYAFNKFDISTPYSSKAFAKYGSIIPLAEAKVGDILVFRGTNPADTRPGHVGIITELDSGKMLFIHSSSSKKHFGVVETEYYTSGYPKRFLKVVRPN